MNEKVRKLVTMAMLAALSIVLVYVIHFPIFPAASFLEYDPADIPIFIATFLSLLSFLSSDNDRTVLSGSKDSSMTGSLQPFSRQTRKMAGIPPLFAASISMRKLPGLDMVIAFRFLMMTKPCLP